MERDCFSEATLGNARYHVGGQASSDHDNEDRSFAMTEKKFCACAVLDGHDGSSAVDLANSQFHQQLHVLNICGEDQISSKLKECFGGVEYKFFSGMQSHVEERSRLQAAIPPGMKSYQAYQMYPREVARLQELESLISGGCTAVVAAVCGNKLYVANVGDSRAVLVYQTPNGALETLQLSTDHDVRNEDELKRLEKLGLDPEKLKRAGRLGPQENTRSIGDYNIKGGYQSVDTLSHATGPPGTAEPSVNTVDIDRGSFLYLMVMSDGVYKSIEAALDEAQTIGANQVLANMVHTYAQTPGMEFSSIAQSTLAQVAHLHEEAFQRSAQQDARSPKAIACRKRDDMTLVLCTFSGHPSKSLQSNQRDQRRRPEATLKEKDKRIVHLETTLKEKDERMIHLETTLKEKDERMIHLETTLKEKDERMIHLETTLKEKDERMIHLETILKEKDERIALLEATLKEKDEGMIYQEVSLKAEMRKMAEIHLNEQTTLNKRNAELSMDVERLNGLVEEYQTEKRNLQGQWTDEKMRMEATLREKETLLRVKDEEMERKEELMKAKKEEVVTLEAQLKAKHEQAERQLKMNNDHLNEQTTLNKRNAELSMDVERLNGLVEEYQTEKRNLQGQWTDEKMRMEAMLREKETLLRVKDEEMERKEELMKAKKEEVVKLEAQLKAKHEQAEMMKNESMQMIVDCHQEGNAAPAATESQINNTPTAIKHRLRSGDIEVLFPMVEAASVHWKTVGEHLGLQCSTEKDSICFRLVLMRWLNGFFRYQPPYLEDLISILQVLGMKEIASNLETNSSLMSNENERNETDM